MTIGSVIFDWGGTLTPWHKIDLSSQWYAFAQEYDPENAAALAEALFQAEERRWQVQRETLGAESTGALHSILQECGVDVTASNFDAAFQRYLDFWYPHTLADADALPLLRALRERGLKIGVLSNTMWPREFHEEVFARDGLLEYIDAGVYTSELPVGKPHKDAFLEAMAALNISDPRSVVFVGDRMWDDIHGAQSVGMRAVFIPHSDHRAHELVETDVVPDAVINRLGDLFNVVRDLQKQAFE
jgi:putative hydrolase of the HAD superfamily